MRKKYYFNLQLIQCFSPVLWNFWFNLLAISESELFLHQFFCLTFCVSGRKALFRSRLNKQRYSGLFYTTMLLFSLVLIAGWGWADHPKPCIFSIVKRANGLILHGESTLTCKTDAYMSKRCLWGVSCNKWLGYGTACYSGFMNRNSLVQLNSFWYLFLCKLNYSYSNYHVHSQLSFSVLHCNIFYSYLQKQYSRC